MGSAAGRVDPDEIVAKRARYVGMPLLALLDECEGRNLPDADTKPELIKELWRADLEAVPLRQLMLIAEMVYPPAADLNHKQEIISSLVENAN